MRSLSVNFFQYAGVHSFLIGLLPFFIPVLLWQRDASIAVISLFVSLTGIGFLISLNVWRILFNQANWRLIVVASFVIEFLLVSSLLFTEGNWFLYAAAILNGAYNCFYWTTQRVMFSAMTVDSSSEANETGKKFGDFQILVVILLKLGILAGAFLLDEGSSLAVVMVSLIITAVSVICFCRETSIASLSSINRVLGRDEKGTAPTTSVFRFKDKYNSATVFYLDGIFLFLESYFWVLSLFLIAKESVMDLGIVIVSLTVLLSVVFYFIKNRIDRLNQQKVFVCAVVLYAISWGLRAELDMDITDYWKYPVIVLIGFMTTFFRLSFNKRFFDNARENDSTAYLLSKSYLSQAGIAVFFGCLALLAYSLDDTETVLPIVYWVLAPVSLVYWAYLTPTELSAKDVSNLKLSN